MYFLVSKSPKNGVYVQQNGQSIINIFAHILRCQACTQRQGRFKKKQMWLLTQENIQFNCQTGIIKSENTVIMLLPHKKEAARKQVVILMIVQCFIIYKEFLHILSNYITKFLQEGPISKRNIFLICESLGAFKQSWG